MANKSNSYAEKINDTKVMLAGLTANIERLGKRGISADFIAKLQGMYDEAKTIDNEQESMKARLKEKSDALHQKMDEVETVYREAKKVVKLEMPKESWKEFGIADRH
jgi:hypothetical protein